MPATDTVGIMYSNYGKHYSYVIYSSAAILTCMYRSEQRRLYIEDLEIVEQTKGARIQKLNKEG